MSQHIPLECCEQNQGGRNESPIARLERVEQEVCGDVPLTVKMSPLGAEPVGQQPTEGMRISSGKEARKIAKIPLVVGRHLRDAHVQGICEELAVGNVAFTDGANIQAGCLRVVTSQARLPWKNLTAHLRFCAAVWCGTLFMQCGEMFCADVDGADLVLTPPVPAPILSDVLFYALRAQPGCVRGEGAV